MSVRPSPNRRNTEPFGSPWTGLTAPATEAADAPPVEANRAVWDDAEPIEEAPSEPVTATAGGAHRPGRKVLIGGLALSAMLHGAALAFFLDQLNPSGLEAETEEAVSIEIVVDAPPQPTVAGTDSGGAEPISADAEEVQAEEKTAAVDGPATADQPEDARTGIEPPAEDTKSERAARDEPAEPDFTPPPPDAAQLQALASPPPIPAEPTMNALVEPSAPAPIEEPRTKDDLIQLSSPAETPPPQPQEEAAALEMAAIPPDVSLPSEAEVPVPTPRHTVEGAKRPASKAADAGKSKKAEPAKDRTPSMVAEAKPTKTAKQAARSEPATTGKKAATSKREQISAAGAAGALGGGSAGAEAKYARTLNNHIQRYKRYPEAAARQKITGVTRLAVTIDRSGRLSAARVADGSGHKVLDEEALSVARRAAPYPPPPEGVGKGTFAFMVSLRFKP